MFPCLLFRGKYRATWSRFSPSSKLIYWREWWSSMTTRPTSCQTMMRYSELPLSLTPSGPALAVRLRGSSTTEKTSEIPPGWDELTMSALKRCLAYRGVRLKWYLRFLCALTLLSFCCRLVQWWLVSLRKKLAKDSTHFRWLHQRRNANNVTIHLFILFDFGFILFCLLVRLLVSTSLKGPSRISWYIVFRCVIRRETQAWRKELTKIWNAVYSHCHLDFFVDVNVLDSVWHWFEITLPLES